MSHRSSRHVPALASPATGAAALLIVVATALASACTSETRSVYLGRETELPRFGAPDASAGDAEVDGGVPIEKLLCVATDCPAPLATCGTGHKCTTDLSTDLHNCGECGHECPEFWSLAVRPRCSAGKCRYECADTDHVDCNELVEDGCEVNVRRDPNNCGACGHTCAPGVRCIEGSCGCPTGLTECDGACVDLQRDNWNCSACGAACPYWTEAGWREPPPNMIYNCRDAQCEKLECVAGYRDCDGDLENGCETSVANDPANCGACGKKCGDGQRCAVPLAGSGAPTCMCPSGMTFCEASMGPVCADLLNDNDNCGACDNECNYLANTAPNVVGQCNQGRCERKCVEGFADCDGDPSNGCEVNLMVDGSNCGACGHWCDTARGQPCIKGTCLMIECDVDGGETTK